jgi:hypothetical protein
MIRFAFVLLAALAGAPAAKAQNAFDPSTVAYVLCVTNETKKLALVMPQIEKNAIVERAFAACADTEREARKMLAGQGANQAALDERFAVIRKFIRQTAEDDIDRLRINRVPR